MGPAAGDYETASVHEKLMSLFDKAGYEVGVGAGPDCGLPSDGFYRYAAGSGRLHLATLSVTCCQVQAVTQKPQLLHNHAASAPLHYQFACGYCVENKHALVSCCPGVDKQAEFLLVDAYTAKATAHIHAMALRPMVMLAAACTSRKSCMFYVHVYIYTRTAD